MRGMVKLMLPTGLRFLASWGGSAAVHAVALVAFSLLAAPNASWSSRERVVELQVAVDAPAPEIQVATTLSPDTSGGSLGRLLADGWNAPELVKSIDVSVDTLTADGLEKVELTDAWRLSADLLGQGVRDGKGERAGTGEGAEFFGSRAQGKRFVFVLDCSSSMRGYRWREATAELNRCLEGLTESQQFLVVGFSHVPMPLPEPRGVRSSRPRLRSATPEAVKHVRHWLRSLEFGYETWPRSSMQIALSLEPDAVFLLSDGELHDDTQAYLKTAQAASPRTIPIHTIGLHSPAAKTVLRLIAEQSGGEFRFIPRFEGG